MILQSVALHNFLGWSHVEFSLANRGLTYLVGPNGAGKSSIPAAILWCLTGKCERAVLADHVIRTWWEPGHSTDCWVSLKFQQDNNNVHVVRHRGFSNTIGISVNGAKVSTRHVKETDDRLSSYFGSYEDLRQSLIFGAGGSRFFTELQEAEQKRVLREMYGFDIFIKAGEYVKEKTRTFESQLTSLAFKLEQAKGSLKAHTGTLQRLEKALAKAEKQAAVDSERVGESLIQVQRKCETVERRAITVNADLNRMLDHRGRMDVIVKEVDHIGLQLNELRQNKVCPQCGRPLRRPELKKQIASLKERKQELLDELKVLEPFDDSKVEGFQVMREKLEAELRGYQKEASALQAQIQVGVGSIEALKQQLASELKLFEAAKVETRSRKRGVDAVEERLRYWDWWRTAYGSRGLETLALQRALPDFNSHVNYYLSQMPTEKGVIESLHYVTDEGRLKHELRHQGGRSYSGASGGERRRVDFAIALARQDLTTNASNVLFLDEPFEHVDDISLIVQQLNRLDKESIFVMSHRGDLDKWFPSVVYFKASNGLCRITGEVSRGIDVTTMGGV